MAQFCRGIILFSYQKLNRGTKWIAITVFAACIPHAVRYLGLADFLTDL